MKKCGVCGALTDKIVTVRSGFPVYECVSCKSLTIDCPYQADEYEENYQFFQLPDDICTKVYIYYARKALEWAKGGRILDVGCGKGTFLRNLKTLDPAAKAMGYDISRSALIYARRLLPTDVQLTNELDEVSGWGKFDVVTSFNVIEHVPDIFTHMRCLVEWSKPGGFVMVATPNLNAINRWRMGLDKWDMIAPPVHLYILSVKGLRALFAAHSLDVVHRSTMSWSFVSGVGKESSWRWLIAKTLGALGMGGNLLIAGRRKLS